MGRESTQPFDINENTGQPSHRPKHDGKRDDIDDESGSDVDARVTPKDVANDTDE